MATGTGRHSHEHRGGVDAACARRCEAAHRPLTQRPGGARYADVAARRDLWTYTGHSLAAKRAGQTWRTKRPRADARLYAPAAGAAGLFRASFARLRGNVGTRPRAAEGQFQTGECLSAGQRSERWFHFAARPQVGGPAAR